MEPFAALRPAQVVPFIAIPVVLILLLAWGAQAAWQRSGAPPARAGRVAITTLSIAALWMAITWFVAAKGIFTEWHRTPPPFALLVFAIVVIAFAIAFTEFGRRLAVYLPLWVLVVVQGFRFPLELAMHGMYEAGIMPIQMSYSGRNFDIVTGLTAFIVAWLLWKGIGGRPLVAAWNLLGLGLLVNVVTVAILGTPRIAYFGPEHLNEWVTHPPFVWLPAVMVLAALAGHLVIFRALAAPRSTAATSQRSHSPQERTTPAQSLKA